MAYVITSACVNHKYQDCVSVCPVDAFREMPTYLVIDPDVCIDCSACQTITIRVGITIPSISRV